MWTSTKRTWVIALTLLAGCAGDVRLVREDGAGGAASGEGGLGGSDAGVGSAGSNVTSSGAGGVEPVDRRFCEQACADGLDGSCFTQEDCLAVCSADAGAWSPRVREAFAACAAEDPLCFVTLEGCMLGELGPRGRLVRVLGFGFDAFEGKTLYVTSDGGALQGAAVIRFGSMQLTFIEDVDTFDQLGPLLLAFLDIDGDGACAPSVDLTAAEYAVWNGSFDYVEYELVLEPPLADPDFARASF